MQHIIIAELHVDTWSTHVRDMARQYNTLSLFSICVFKQLVLSVARGSLPLLVMALQGEVLLVMEYNRGS